jgi:hypothetical protein
MRIILKTRIQKVSISIILLVLITIALFLYDQKLVGTISLIMILALSIYFYQLVPEELIIYFLKKNSGRMEREKLIAELSARAEKAIERMAKKGKLALEDGYVILLNPYELSALEERKK